MDACSLTVKGNALAFQVRKKGGLGRENGIWGDENGFMSKVLRNRKCVSGRSLAGRGKEGSIVSVLTSNVNSETKDFQAPVFARERAEPKNVASIILGGGTGAELFPLTSTRATAAVPVGGCYRLIDIPMSNCINSGINKIFIMTQFNSASLNRHIARTYNFSNGINFGDGFVEVLAATQSPGEAGMNWFQGTADAVRQFSWVFEDNRNKNIEHIIILSGDHLYRMDYMDFVQKHIDAGADITVSCVPVDESRASDYGLIKLDKMGHIVQFSEKPKGADLECMAYMFNDYWEDIGKLKSFFDANLALTEQPPKFHFYDPKTPFYTSPRFLPPTKVDKSRIVDAIVSHGCFLRECSVQHSIVGVRSRLDYGVELKDTVMMGADLYETEAEIASLLSEDKVPIGVGENTKIRNCIIDMNARVGKNVIIQNKDGVREANRPSEGYIIKEGITIVLKNATIKDGTII
ncbi:probable glucose-1-phosphate adenylyltransferase large subunit, chloroplastic isoform X2 [Phalaenopsis equestris]|uniref:probable glucose-1-phosphate adenylyltransferase large subunit, chloroplastic isoform X2 n=1 Tax=Phalaenopsis equestris TaxID=78828 RepID=UPI0009E640D5|nr:probable glucose-1-phosphate adenylyltransferase large subunit, chloroplastic isoform X2 [Phalaenopsis equestris]